ncbi:MAG: VanZ family protein [Pricia sp.]
MLRTRKFTIAFFGWMTFVTWASLSSFPDDGTPTIDIPHFDKFVHFCFYLGAAVLGALFVREIARGRFPLVKTLILVVLGAIMFGIIIEVLQYTFTVDRMGDSMDALANSLGAIFGGSVTKWLFSWRNGLKWK